MQLLITYEISLDMVKTNYVVIKAKQYDKNSRVIKIHCTENGKEFILSDNIRAFVQMSKPDNTIYEKDCVIDKTKNVLIFNLEEQATTTSGLCKAELVLVNAENESVLSTMIFNIIVINSLITQEDIISQTEFGTLANLIIGYEEANQTMQIYEEEVSNWSIGETQRQANERIRINNENTRLDNERIRTDAEYNRNVVEQTRQSNENTRKAAETTRINNENARQSAEQGRAKFEKDRATAEQTRINNENTRISNENIRVSAENNRISTYNMILAKHDNGEFDGRTVLYGEGDPANSLGYDGDVYINTLTTGHYGSWLFTKDGGTWTPRWVIRGIDGTDTLPLQGLILYPDDLDMPAGYTEASGDFGLTTSSISYNSIPLDDKISSIDTKLNELQTGVDNVVTTVANAGYQTKTQVNNLIDAKLVASSDAEIDNIFA